MAVRGHAALNVVIPKPKRKKPTHEETKFHIEAVKFLGLILPKDAVFFHVPNGGERNPKEAAILKAMGTLAGMLDIVILWDRRAFILEFKARDGELSIDQRAVIARLETAGIPVEVVRSFEEIAARLGEFGIPLRRTVRFGGEYRLAA